MKTSAIILWALATASHCVADTSPRDFAPTFSTNTLIIWNAPTHHLPKEFWIYEKLSTPKIFSSEVVSNAIVLASLQNRGFPQASTNEIHFSQEQPCPCACQDLFCVIPQSATLSFVAPNLDKAASLDITTPRDQIISSAWHAASQLGLESDQLGPKEPVSRMCSFDEKGEDVTNGLPCGRGVFLSRRIDGIDFIGNGTDGFKMEGFYIEFGSGGKIRYFNLVWPNLKRSQSQSTASTQQLLECIKARRAIVLPNPNEDSYFERVRT